MFQSCEAVVRRGSSSTIFKVASPLSTPGPCQMHRGEVDKFTARYLNSGLADIALDLAIRREGSKKRSWTEITGVFDNTTTWDTLDREQLPEIEKTSRTGFPELARHTSIKLVTTDESRQESRFRLRLAPWTSIYTNHFLFWLALGFSLDQLEVTKKLVGFGSDNETSPKVAGFFNNTSKPVVIDAKHGGSKTAQVRNGEILLNGVTAAGMVKETLEALYQETVAVEIRVEDTSGKAVKERQRRQTRQPDMLSSGSIAAQAQNIIDAFCRYSNVEAPILSAANVTSFTGQDNGHGGGGKVRFHLIPVTDSQAELHIDVNESSLDTAEIVVRQPLALNGLSADTLTMILFTPDLDPYENLYPLYLITTDCKPQVAYMEQRGGFTGLLARVDSRSSVSRSLFMVESNHAPLGVNIVTANGCRPVINNQRDVRITLDVLLTPRPRQK